MPTHLLLEGEDIESVLARLREDHGPDAKIVQAELVRSGGFAGFFARRRYEVTVEVEDDELDVAPAPPFAESGAGGAEPESHSLTTDFRPVRPYVPSASPAPTYAARDELPGMNALLSAAEGQDQADFGGRALATDAPSAASAASAAPAASDPGNRPSRPRAGIGRSPPRGRRSRTSSARSPTRSPRRLRCSDRPPSEASARRTSGRRPQPGTHQPAATDKADRPTRWPADASADAVRRRLR